MATGTQQNPLDVFYGAGGTTGNKTTNKDLPEWLRALGMKGDAYAGGMLKPELRYGFKYKDGKIHFADGNSYAAKKTKGADGKVAYSYTDASGAAANYSPTDEQNAYNKSYKKATADNGFFGDLKKTLAFELDHLKQLGGDFKLNNVFFGVDPLGVKIGNAVTGRDDKALVTALGGATDERFADYERRNGPGSLGFAPQMHEIAATVAGSMAGGGLGKLASAGAASLGAGAGKTLATTLAGALNAPGVASNLVSLGNGLLSPTGQPTGAPSQYAGMSPNAQGPFGPLAAAGNAGTYNDSNGTPLQMGQFDPNGFRDQDASNYLANALGMPPTAMGAPAASGYAPPAGLESFSGMDFGSMFGNLLGMKLPTAGPQSSPKMAPALYPQSGMAPTAMAGGSRGPDPSALAGLSALAGPLGNGGGTLAPKTYPRSLPRAVK